jgi:(S)-2-hydroxy-acid oxidase
MVLSTWATSTIEEVAQSSPKGLKWFHMYMLTNENDNLSRIRRAEKEGYKALVVTVDAPYRGSTTKDPLYMPPHLSYINVESYNCVLNNPDTATEEELTGVNPKNTWDMIQWLRSV